MIPTLTLQLARLIAIGAVIGAAACLYVIGYAVGLACLYAFAY